MTLPTLHLAPLIPLWLMLPAVMVGLALLWRGARQGILAWPRLLCLLLLLAALLNPQLQRDDSLPIGDIALIVVDNSGSMMLGSRAAQSAAALAELQKKLAGFKDLETRVVTLPAAAPDEGTRLFGAIEAGLAEIPKSRLAGVIVISDGQVHDLPANPLLGAPLHLLLAGSRQDRDRRLVMDGSPGFAMVGSQAEFAFHIEDPGHDGSAVVTLRRDGGAVSTVSMPLNRPTKLSVPIDHAGPNVIEIDVAAVPGELTLNNNRSAVGITGVRDRLRVLLLSGEPHPGERMWRNLLKADPSVDLVHFTILRSPDKDDHTPIQQLSLIAFPTRELFEERLKDFDLIIFDRFRRRNILPPAYYRNIRDHVREGGAMLLVAGPELAAPDSPAGSALADILPARSDGTIFSQPFLPTVTELGHRHPLFQGLPGATDAPAHWGRWVRAAGSVPAPGAEVVMSTPTGTPLLVLSRAGEGRVAQLNSDSAWLWGRGWEGGGPQAELLRRLAHWLMKEPELEENRLDGQVAGGSLHIERHGLEVGNRTVTVTRPDGTTVRMELADRGNGLASGDLPADQNGLWRISDDSLTALVAVGSLDLLEMGDVRATPDKLRPAVTANGGGIAWIEDGIPGIVRPAGDSQMAGPGWFGLRANDQRSVSATTSYALIPGWLLLLLATALMSFAWWRDGRR